MHSLIKNTAIGLSALSLIVLSGCESEMSSSVWATPEAEQRANIYTDFTLTSDLSHLSDNQVEMVGLLIDAAEIMDDLFWLQAYGDKANFPDFKGDENARSFFMKNYGPWDRLDGDKPFLASVDDKPLGANFYPTDMSKEEFDAFENPDKEGLYSVIERDENGQLKLIAYHDLYAEQLATAADILRRAAPLAEDEEFGNYLLMRADALETDNYQPSDFAWMDMKNNEVELVIGAIETYEDLLYGYRAGYEGYVLIKDLVWSEKLKRFATFLPELQRGLPVDDAYKAEIPGSNSDLGAYDAVYYSGHSNAGSKTIAINLPNDEAVQLEKGTRRLQLKNAMRAKFDKILLPISAELIAEEQRKHVTFNAFFSGVMFHEVAHGLGIKQTLDGTNTVRGALRETASSFEEGKADILGLYMIKSLYEKGEITEGSMMDYYVTFMAGIFRSSRFGASSAHGRANMIRFNYFQDMGAFSRSSDGKYSINFDKFTAAMDGLSNMLLTIQGDGDYDRAKALLSEKGIISDTMAQDLARLEQANIPVDINFIQGKSVLGLE